MDPLLRGGRLLLALAALGACVPPEPGPPVGVSSPRAVVDVPRDASADAPAAAPSPVPPDFRAHMTKVVERGVSRGHAERFDGIVWTNEAAHAGWVGSGEMPDGATLVEEAIERTGKGDRAAGLLVMQKQAGAWRFVVVDAGGHVVEWSREAACIACHRDAPRDFVFHVDATLAAPAPDAGKKD